MAWLALHVRFFYMEEAFMQEEWEANVYRIMWLHSNMKSHHHMQWSMCWFHAISYMEVQSICHITEGRQRETVTINLGGRKEQVLVLKYRIEKLLFPISITIFYSHEGYCIDLLALFLSLCSIFSIFRMDSCQGLLILLFLETTCACSCPHHCTCDPLDQTPQKVNCSFRELKTLSLLPNSTQELCLQCNQLETIPAGTFDHLQVLRVINLSSNRWHCDCGILYLKNWLEDQAGSMLISDVRCFSPPSLHQREISDLTWREFPSCSIPRRLCSDFLFRDVLLFVLLGLIFIFLIWIVLLAKRISFKVEICNSTEVSHILPSTQLKRRTGRQVNNSSYQWLLWNRLLSRKKGQANYFCLKWNDKMIIMARTGFVIFRQRT